MVSSRGTQPLLEQVLSGGNRQLQELAAGGLLPLPPDQLIPVQVSLARGPDPELAERARQSLKTLDLRIAAPFLERQAGPDELSFFAAEVARPLVVETILRRRDVPRSLLIDMARWLPGDLQEILLLRQDAILDEPAILAALEKNPQLTPYSRRRIGEYREHLLPQRGAGLLPPAAALRAAAAPRTAREAPDEEAELAAELESARRLPAAGEVEAGTGLSEGQIRLLPVASRLRLTRNASRVMRGILLRDQNAQVAVAVLHNNSFSDQEIEGIARSRAVIEDVLEEIAKHRGWVGRYGIAKALIQNPKTPVPVSLRLMGRLGVRDLRDVSRDRNVPDAVRSNALRLYTIKQK